MKILNKVSLNHFIGSVTSKRLVIFFIHLDIPNEEKLQRRFELMICATDENEQDNHLSREELNSKLGQVCT